MGLRKERGFAQSLSYGWNVVDYRDCEDLPPDVIDFWDNELTQFDKFTPSLDPFGD